MKVKTVKSSMADFDKLPPEFRVILREANYNWAASHVLKIINSIDKNAQKFQKVVKSWDAAQAVLNQESDKFDASISKSVMGF